MSLMRDSRRSFAAVSAAVFAASATLTIAWSASMPATCEMPMPGGWTMSMAWMRMPGQTWPGAAASFLGMWAVMMVAMMQPSLAPMLWRYRQAVRRSGGARLGRLTTLVGLGYYGVWIGFGIVAFGIGVALAAAEMERPGLRAPSRSRPASSSSSPVHCSSPRGRRTTWPAVVRHPGPAVPCRPTPARPGGTASASASTAVSAAPA